MTDNPIVLIPPSAPSLEAVALAILGGAAEEGATASNPHVVADPSGDITPTDSAGLVFLGWQADSEESRRRCGQTLAALITPATTPRLVALFAVSLRGSAGDPDASPADQPPLASSNVQLLGPPQSFVVDCGPAGDSVGVAELARAHRWGARTYSRWRSTVRGPHSAERRADSTPTTPPPLSWCGAVE
jgi:hypothetical protein